MYKLTVIFSQGQNPVNFGDIQYPSVLSSIIEKIIPEYNVYMITIDNDMGKIDARAYNVNMRESFYLDANIFQSIITNNHVRIYNTHKVII